MVKITKKEKRNSFFVNSNIISILKKERGDVLDVVCAFLTFYHISLLCADFEKNRRIGIVSRHNIVYITI